MFWLDDSNLDEGISSNDCVQVGVKAWSSFRGVLYWLWPLSGALCTCIVQYQKQSLSCAVELVLLDKSVQRLLERRPNTCNYTSSFFSFRGKNICFHSSPASPTVYVRLTSAMPFPSPIFAS
jgi:hypothetical protein